MMMKEREQIDELKNIAVITKRNLLYHTYTIHQYITFIHFIDIIIRKHINILVFQNHVA